MTMLEMSSEVMNHRDVDNEDRRRDTGFPVLRGRYGLSETIGSLERPVPLEVVRFRSMTPSDVDQEIWEYVGRPLHCHEGQDAHGKYPEAILKEPCPSCLAES